MNSKDLIAGPPSSSSATNRQGVKRERDEEPSQSTSSGPRQVFEAHYFTGPIVSSFQPANLKLLPFVSRPIPTSSSSPSSPSSSPPILVGPRPPSKLTDFVEPFSNGFCRQWFPPRYAYHFEEILEGSRVLWLGGPPETGLWHWTHLVFPREHYLYVDKPTDLKLYDKLKHKGVVVQGELCPERWSLSQVLHLIFTGTVFDTGRFAREEMTIPMPKGCPRIVLNRFGVAPSQFLRMKYGWNDNNILYGRVANWIVNQSVVKLTKESDPGRLRVRYRSKFKGEEVVCDLGVWRDLPGILAMVANKFEEMGERKRKLEEEEGGGDDEGDENKAKKLKLEGEEEKMGLEGSGGEGDDKENKDGEGDEEGKKVDTGVKAEGTSEGVDRDKEKKTGQVSQGQKMTDSVEETVFEEGKADTKPKSED